MTHPQFNTIRGNDKITERPSGHFPEALRLNQAIRTRKKYLFMITTVKRIILELFSTVCFEFLHYIEERRGIIRQKSGSDFKIEYKF